MGRNEARESRLLSNFKVYRANRVNIRKLCPVSVHACPCRTFIAYCRRVGRRSSTQTRPSSERRSVRLFEIMQRGSHGAQFL